MKVLSLIVCGLLALPALAQESKPTPNPKGAQQAGPQNPDITEEEKAFLAHKAAKLAAQAERVARARQRIGRASDGQLARDRHVAKVPAADQALLDIQKAAQEARSAKDLATPPSRPWTISSVP